MNFLGRKPNLHKLPVGRPPIEYLKKKETFSVSTPVYLKLAYKRICESLGLNPNKQTVNMITAFCLQHLSTLKDQDSCIFLVNGKYKVLTVKRLSELIKSIKDATRKFPTNIKR